MDGAYNTKVLHIKVFSPDYNHVEKVNISSGYWDPQRKLGVAMHFSEIVSFESRSKMLRSAFFLKKKKNVFLHRFP